MKRASLLFVCLFCALPVVAQEVVVRIENAGEIDWTRSVVRSSGSSASPTDTRDRSQRIAALSAATSAAAENLMKTVQQITLNSGETILEASRSSATLRQRVSELVQRFTIRDTRSMSDMSVEVDLEMPLTADVATLFMPAKTGGGAWRLDDIPRSPLSLLPWPECREVPAGVTLVMPSQGLLAYDGKPFTGLIIDARQVPLVPALLPRILNEKGEEVYGVDYVSREAAIEYGLLSYTTSLLAAKKDERIGNKPLVVCGLRATGNHPTDVVLSANDAVLIHAAAKTNNFLKQCKVVVVLSP